MTQIRRSLQTGELWQALVTGTDQGLTAGALQPIATEQVIIPDGNIDFVVRVASSLRLKAQQKQPAATGRSTPFNPFLPPEPILTLGRVMQNHLAILNKFNVVDYHLLVVTEQFEHQETILTQNDFNALYWCLREFDALGFYNGGTNAGASQPHKHLQLAPRSKIGNQGVLPLETLFDQPHSEGITRLPIFPFENAFTWLEFAATDHLMETANLARQTYLRLLASVHIDAMETPDGLMQSAPYNLLVTREWMLLIPRSAECSAGISINALGYAGSLFVPNSDLLGRIHEIGPINLLKTVSHETFISS